MTETKKAKGGSQIIRLALILFIVSAITSGVLGLVNMLTKDTIAAQEEAARAEAYQAVLAFGVSSDYIITGASVIDHAETSGLGAKITEQSFTDSFIGQGEGMAVTKDGGTIDTITAATISSRAMANAANTAIAAVQSLG